MDQHLRTPSGRRPAPPTTRAADGLPRRKWSAAEVQRMIEAGIIAHGEPFELIGGELVAMAAKGAHQDRARRLLDQAAAR